ncbi:MAG: PLDc N-terminal domain-containing protein, partial [Phycisphaerae bacterium]|nr:PLDc N-terminal domain-containing protein [Phycisphaerae bacterium]
MVAWTLIAVDWGLALALVPFIMRKQRPVVKLAWIAFVFALPFVGSLFYILIGESRLGHARVRRRGEIRRLINKTARSELVAPHVVAPRTSAEHADLTRLTERLGDIPVLGGNRVTILGGGDEMIDALVKDIEQARHHVHLLYYIYAGDRTGLRVAEALRSAAKRGVVCRVLIDDAGSWGRLGRVDEYMLEGGVIVRRALPVSILRVPFKRIDVRNHRKLAVIDGLVSYVGSQNIIDAFLSKELGAYEDLTLRVTGPAVMALQMTFVDDWLAETSEQLEGESYYPRIESEPGMALQIVRSGPPYPPDAFSHLITAAIHESNERVTVTTPYFIPDEPTIAALRIAALRGVKVEVMVPMKSDAWIGDAAARAHFDTLLEVGVNV